MIVVDASVVVELVLVGPAFDAIRRQIERAGNDAHAPHLLDVEVAHALRRHNARGLLSNEEGVEALSALSELDIARYPHSRLLWRTWALRHEITAYDAVYVALAEALGAPLLTLDRRLAAAARDVVRVVEAV